MEEAEASTVWGRRRPSGLAVAVGVSKSVPLFGGGRWGSAVASQELILSRRQPKSQAALRTVSVGWIQYP